MSNTKVFLIKLLFLAIPFAIITFILHDGTPSGGVGGGGYDLSGLVYGSLLFLIIVLWLLWMIISYSLSKDIQKKKVHSRLLIIGFAALVLALFVTPRMF
ncbi:MAG: hypothetical protein EOO45_22665 [Flavobacterium sp.]|nr:MAG: hypothetical protein EOO45_22665 [Flavobacterium sp.]